MIHVREDFDSIRKCLPGEVLVWSAMIPKWSWKNALHPRLMNEASKSTNREIKVVHPTIKAARNQLY